MKWIQKRDEKREYVAEFYSQVRFDASVDFRPKAFLAALDGYVNLRGNYIDEAYQLIFAHETSEGDSDYFAAGIELRICWPAVDEDIIIPPFLRGILSDTLRGVRKISGRASGR